MKVGFFGGLLLLGLTIIFSMIAIQNNKIAREVAVKSFNLDQAKESKQEVAKESKDENATLKDLVTKKDKVANKANPSKQEDKGFMDDFDKKFSNFDKQFNNF